MSQYHINLQQMTHLQLGHQCVTLFFSNDRSINITIHDHFSLYGPGCPVDYTKELIENYLKSQQL